jgi:hypothetical protein
MTPIPRPSPEQVQYYLDLWSAKDDQKIDSALKTLFTAMPHNTDVGEVGVKVSALNALYATGILAVFQMASHITRLDIDARLAPPATDFALVEDIATFKIGGKIRRNYSFATKYCSFHRPDVYPIYDRLVARVLNTILRQHDEFDTFERGEHWHTDFAVWHRSITRFRCHYDLQDFSIRDIDKYLWTLAKERQALST